MPGNRSQRTGTPASRIRCAYCSASSRSGSYSQLRMVAGGNPRSVAAAAARRRIAPLGQIPPPTKYHRVARQKVPSANSR